MAKFRYINTRIWIDDYISNLSIEQKLFFIYLLTNPYTDICGVYEIPLKIMSAETGFSIKKIEEILKKFEKDGKIFYFSGWVGIKNFIKHQAVNPKVKKGIEIGLKNAPKELIYDRLCIGYESLSYSNTNSNSNINARSFFLEEFTNKQLIEIMYNYCDIDEDGNPILKKNRLKRVNKSENTELIKVGLLWRKLCAEYLKVKEEEVVMKNIYYPIRSVYDREKYTLKDYEKLFNYFFNDKKIKQEDKMGFDLCMSEKYVAKYKIAKRSVDRPVSNNQIAESIKL